MYKTDNIDIEIVNLRIENGRMAAAEIARQVGNISERAVRYRIQRMVDLRFDQLCRLFDRRKRH